MLNISIQYQSSSGSQYIMLTKLLLLLLWKGRKGGITKSIFHETRSKVYQIIWILILFCMSNIRILAQATLKMSCWQGFFIAKMEESKKEHKSVNISWNSFKCKSGHLNIDPNQYAKYQNPSSSGSQDIILQGFSVALMEELKKGSIT